MQINPLFQQSNKLQNNYFVLSNQSSELNHSKTFFNEISEPKLSNNSLKKLNSEQKLSNALKLLSNISFNISEIAYSIGYNDPKYFSRCFKRQFGMTPKDFRDSRFKSMRITNNLNFDEKFVTKATAIVQEKITQQTFGVDELASELNVSYSTLYRKIKTTSGISPCDFIRKARIKNAKQMLTQKSLSFSDVAFAAGFCNYSYFSRCFKSEFGLFPSEYVQKLKMG